jgi:hypothetical protein
MRVIKYSDLRLIAKNSLFKFRFYLALTNIIGDYRKSRDYNREENLS